MRPRAFGMRIVIGPHKVVHEVPLGRQLESGTILLESRRAVGAKILAGRLLELRIGPQMMLPVRLVHRIQRPWNPSDAAFDGGEPELRKALQHAGTAEARNRLDGG